MTRCQDKIGFKGACDFSDIQEPQRGEGHKTLQKGP